MQLLSCGRSSEPYGARASGSGATKGPESHAADGCWCCSAVEAAKVGRGSVELQARVRVRVRWPSIVKRQNAANVVWAAEAADVGRAENPRGAEPRMSKAREAVLSR
jgi:hypothetical protein